MSKVKKNIIIVSLFVVVSVGITVAYVSTKINPIEIKKAIVSAIEKSLPGSSVDIANVDYSIGFSSDFKINQLQIKDKANELLLSSKDINVNIPIWSILTGGGDIDILILKPEVNYITLKNGSNNWYNSIDAVESSSKDKNSVSTERKQVDASVQLPSFIKNSKLNFSLEGAKVIYVNMGNKSEIIVDKVLFKNLSLSQTTAYEVVSKLNYKLSDTESVKLNVHLVGEVDFSSYLESSRLSMSSLLTLKNIEFMGANKIKIPTIKNVFKLDYDKNKSTQVDNRLEIGQLGTTKFKLSISKLVDVLAFSSIQADFDLTQLKSFIKLPVDLREGRIQIFGDTSLNLNSMSLNPNIMIKTPKNLDIVIEGEQLISSLDATITGKKVDLNLSNQALGGEFKTRIKTNIDFLNIPSKLTNYSPINIEMTGTNLSFSRKYISEILYKPATKTSSKSYTSSKKIQAINEQNFFLEFPPVDMIINLKNVKLDDKSLSLSSNVLFKNSTINTKLNLRTNAEGSMEGNSVTNFKRKEISNKLNFTLRAFEFTNVSAFLPPFLSELRGVTSGEFDGEVKVGERLNYDINSNLSVIDGEVKGLNVDQMLGELSKKISFLGDKVNLKNIGEKFDSLLFKGVLSTQKISVKNLIFERKPKLKLDLKGSVSMSDRPSKLLGRIEINKSKVNPVPLLLKGDGFVLLPDFKYTTDKLTEKVYKATVKKEKNKIKTKLENKAKELLKGFKF